MDIILSSLRVLIIVFCLLPFPVFPDSIFFYWFWSLCFIWEAFINVLWPLVYVCNSKTLKGWAGAVCVCSLHGIHLHKHCSRCIYTKTLFIVYLNANLTGLLVFLFAKSKNPGCVAYGFLASGWLGYELWVFNAETPSILLHPPSELCISFPPCTFPSPALFLLFLQKITFWPSPGVTMLVKDFMGSEYSVNWLFSNLSVLSLECHIHFSWQFLSQSTEQGSARQTGFFSQSCPPLWVLLFTSSLPG